MSDPTATLGPVLVVEDDPQVRQTIQWALEDEGLAVQTAADGRQALMRATEHRPALVVLDVGLPVLDGEVVAAKLHACTGQPIPIILVTADGRAAEKAQRVNAFAYLSKPFELDDLLTTVRRVLEGPHQPGG